MLKWLVVQGPPVLVELAVVVEQPLVVVSLFLRLFFVYIREYGLGVVVDIKLPHSHLVLLPVAEILHKGLVPLILVLGEDLLNPSKDFGLTQALFLHVPSVIFESFLQVETVELLPLFEQHFVMIFQVFDYLFFVGIEVCLVVRLVKVPDLVYHVLDYGVIFPEQGILVVVVEGVIVPCPSIVQKPLQFEKQVLFRFWGSNLRTKQIWAIRVLCSFLLIFYTVFQFLN